MIRMTSAFTGEIDDEAAAVAEIAAQLDGRPAGGGAARLCIVHCHREFRGSGVLEALGRYLDGRAGGSVPLCGLTCASSGTDAGYKSDLGLSLCLLESTDVRFRVSHIPALHADTLGADMDALCEPFVKDTERPGMFLAFFPVIDNISGERMIAEIDRRTGGIPLFGGLASSEAAVTKNSYIVYGGTMYESGVVLAGLYGNVEPRFITANVLVSDIVPLKDKVTGARGNALCSIGGRKALDYLMDTGFISGAAANDSVLMHGVPLVFTPEDGSRVIRNSVTADLDTGEVTLTGEVPERAAIGLAIFNSDVIKRSAEEGLLAAKEAARGRSALIYSCMVRRWLLPGESEAEQRLAHRTLGGSVPYNFAYAGGEVFPTEASGGRLVNRLQNESIIICVL